jgi:chromatin segregation and condensation protein Rec8/ScpA/Scc1 (kleisin family)
MARVSKKNGKKSKAKARKASPAKSHKAAKTSPTDKRRRNAARETEVARLKHELKEALEHQTATSEVLQVIGGSMADAQPVFERILDSIERLFSFKTMSVFLAPGDGLLHLAGRRELTLADLTKCTR